MVEVLYLRYVFTDNESDFLAKIADINVRDVGDEVETGDGNGFCWRAAIDDAFEDTAENGAEDFAARCGFIAHGDADRYVFAGVWIAVLDKEVTR